jgi:hypothetical protein
MMATAKKAPARKAPAKKSPAKKSPAKKTTGKTQVTAVTVADYVAAVEDPRRRAEAQVLVPMMEAIAGEPGRMWGPSIVGFGTYAYRYDSGREGTMCMIGFSPRKPATVVYMITGYEQQKERLARLGPHEIGKSCLYLKSLDRIDLAVLREMLEASFAAMLPQRIPTPTA